MWIDKIGIGNRGAELETPGPEIRAPFSTRPGRPRKIEKGLARRGKALKFAALYEKESSPQ
jgi:hypothetical protein